MYVRFNKYVDKKRGRGSLNVPLKKNHIFQKTMKGLDTVESLSDEASANLSTNKNCLISTTVKWDQFGCSTAFA